MKSFVKILSMAFLGAVLVLSACRKTDDVKKNENLVSNYSNDVIYDWNELWLVIDKDALGYRPGPGPKNLGYIGLAAYEICVPGMPDFNSIKSTWGSELKIPDLDANTEIHWPTALNASYAYLFDNFFRNTNFVSGIGHITNADAHRMINNMKAKFEDRYKKEVSETVYNNSKAWGEDVARAVFEWAKSDAYGFEADLNPLNNDPGKPNYYDWKKEMQYDEAKKVSKPGNWYPTDDNPNGGMFPLWGRARAFVSTEAQKLCPPPIPYSEDPKSPYYAQAIEVYNTCNSNMSYEDRWISEFWSDDIFGQTFSPPSRIIAIFNQILKKEDSNLEKAVEGVGKLGLGLNDFAVCCWNSKYYYKVERPENFIQRLIDPNWQSILVNTVNGARGVTPAFPAYPSGHSTFGGGGGVLLADIFGDNYNFTDNCHNNRSEFIGKARTFGSFQDAGYENAFSRVTLGVHFRMDCTAGVQLGQTVARRVLALPWKK